MNIKDYIIRQETEKDCREVEEMAREAFWNLSVPGCSEHYFIHLLRQHKAFLPQLDYVLESDGRILGCVMYSESDITDEQGCKRTVLTMGPLCVRKGYQRQGLGIPIMRKLAELHDGRLEVLQEDGKFILSIWLKLRPVGPGNT